MKKLKKFHVYASVNGVGFYLEVKARTEKEAIRKVEKMKVLVDFVD